MHVEFLDVLLWGGRVQPSLGGMDIMITHTHKKRYLELDREER